MKVYTHFLQNESSETMICNVVDENISLAQFINEVEHGFNRQNSQLNVQIRQCKNGEPITDLNRLFNSYFQENSDVFLKFVQASAPLKVIPQKDTIKYEAITKYTFSEGNDKYAKVYIDLPGISAHPKDLISSRFFEQSFDLTIHDFNKKDFRFGVPKTQCKLNSQDSQYTIKNDRITIWIRKLKKEDNWFSLHKTKTIGGDDD